VAIFRRPWAQMIVFSKLHEEGKSLTKVKSTAKTIDAREFRECLRKYMESIKEAHTEIDGALTQISGSERFAVLEDNKNNHRLIYSPPSAPEPKHRRSRTAEAAAYDMGSAEATPRDRLREASELTSTLVKKRTAEFFCFRCPFGANRPIAR
jgi:hypothetical protein